MRVRRIDEDDFCRLLGVEDESLSTDPQLRWPRRFALRVIASVPKGMGDYGSGVTHKYPSSPAGAAWLKEVASGDRVILVGKVAETHIDRIGNDKGERVISVSFYVAEAHVEKP